MTAYRCPDGESVDELSSDVNVLMIAAAAGSHFAFERIYNLTSARVFGVILRAVVDRSMAEEVLEDVYVYVWRHAERFVASRVTVVSWICAIAHRRAVACVRAPQAAARRDRP